MFLVGGPDIDWIATEKILQEYREILRRKKFGLTETVIQKWERMLEEVILIVPDSIIIAFPRDQKDAIFLSCALSADADFLITGDKDFSEAKKITNTTILSAALFKKLIMDRPTGL